MMTKEAYVAAVEAVVDFDGEVRELCGSLSGALGMEVPTDAIRLGSGVREAMVDLIVGLSGDVGGGKYYRSWLRWWLDTSPANRRVYLDGKLREINTAGDLWDLVQGDGRKSDGPDTFAS